MSRVKRAVDRRDRRLFLHDNKIATMPRQMDAKYPVSVRCMSCGYGADDVVALKDAGKAPTRCPYCSDIMGDV